MAHATMLPLGGAMFQELCIDEDHAYKYMCTLWRVYRANHSICKNDYIGDIYIYRLSELVTPQAIKEKVYTHSYFGFSQYMKKTFILRYEDSCTTQNCYVCRSNWLSNIM